MSDKLVTLSFSKGPAKTHTGKQKFPTDFPLCLETLSVAGPVKPLSLGFSTDDVGANEQGETEDSEARKGQYYHCNFRPVISLTIDLSGFLQEGASFDCQQKGTVYEKDHHSENGIESSLHMMFCRLSATLTSGIKFRKSLLKIWVHLWPPLLW